MSKRKAGEASHAGMEDVDDGQREVKNKVYRCTICAATYNDSKMISQHIRRQHEGAMCEGTEKKLKPKNCIVKDEIDVVVESQAKLKTDYPYPCPHEDCEKGYLSKVARRAHLKQKHSTKYRYCCTVTGCGRLEFDNQGIGRHFKRNHPKEEFKIEDCKVLMTKIYEEAEAKGTKVEQVSYPCNVKGCTKVCEFPYRLRNHLQSHNMENRTCQYCYKILNNPAICQNHVAVLHDVSKRKYKCDKGNGCEKSFVCEATLLDAYETQMVKKLVVKMAKKEEPTTVINFTEYEPYHLYHESALSQVVDIMCRQKLTTKNDTDLLVDIKAHLNKILNKKNDGDEGLTTVRGHPLLVFDKTFQFMNKDNIEDLEMQLRDEMNEDYLDEYEDLEEDNEE